MPRGISVALEGEAGGKRLSLSCCPLCQTDADRKSAIAHLDDQGKLVRAEYDHGSTTCDVGADCFKDK